MFKIATGLVLVFGLIIACNNGEENDEEKQREESKQGINAFFKEGKLPFQLTDTSLAKNTDTTAIPSSSVDAVISDTIKNYFGKTASVRYTSIAKFEQQEKESYYVVKASTKTKAAALLLVADHKKQLIASAPFLLPDNDPNTGQASAIDKNFTITKTVTLKSGYEIVGEGKQVLSFDASSKNFSLIMEDMLKDNPGELRNPIDTFPKTHKLAGDYFIDKKNILSVRDGRYPNQLLVFIHTENAVGDCIGQMRGEFIMTSSTTAAFRQGGDPCVLNINFKGNTATINEVSGCGNYRGLDCVFNGTFTRKKSPSVKQATNKAKPK